MLHEFLHALAFHHEHQNMKGVCRDEFRWDDDAGYEPTTTAGGTFTADGQGRRPGIYTYLAGPPNSWSRAKVDHNLRPDEDAHTTASAFDQKSIMLYRFPQIFYKTTPSPCAPLTEAVSLSAGDCKGLQFLYPHDEGVALAVERRSVVLENLLGGGDEGLEAAGGIDTGIGPSEYLRAAAAVYARKSGGNSAS